MLNGKQLASRFFSLYLFYVCLYFSGCLSSAWSHLQHLGLPWRHRGKIPAHPQGAPKECSLSWVDLITAESSHHQSHKVVSMMPFFCRLVGFVLNSRHSTKYCGWVKSDKLFCLRIYFRASLLHLWTGDQPHLGTYKKRSISGSTQSEHVF